MLALIRLRARPSRDADRGAAAVEFVLLMPLLLLIVFGTIDFGRMYAARITLTQAAREGVRVWALGTGGAAPTSANVQSAVAASATGLTGSVTSSTTACTNGSRTDVTVNYTFRFLTPIGQISQLFGASVGGGNVAMSATASMECDR